MLFYCDSMMFLGGVSQQCDFEGGRYDAELPLRGTMCEECVMCIGGAGEQPHAGLCGGSLQPNRGSGPRI